MHFCAAVVASWLRTCDCIAATAPRTVLDGTQPSAAIAHRDMSRDPIELCVYCGCLVSDFIVSGLVFFCALTFFDR